MLLSSKINNTNQCNDVCSMYLAKIKVDSRKEWKNGPWDVPKSFELNSWSKKLIVVRVRSLISRKSKLKDEM